MPAHYAKAELAERGQLNTSKKANRNNPEKRNDFMTAERKMLFPFTNQDEILYWEKCYTDAQKPERKQKEKDVIKIRKNVKARQTHKNPGGYLTKCELMKMGDWKRWTLPSQIENNPDGHVEKITAEVFSLD